MLLLRPLHTPECKSRNTPTHPTNADIHLSRLTTRIAISRPFQCAFETERLIRNSLSRLLCTWHDETRIFPFRSTFASSLLITSQRQQNIFYLILLSFQTSNSCTPILFVLNSKPANNAQWPPPDIWICEEPLTPNWSMCARI
jgi:hypothetical protein